MNNIVKSYVSHNNALKMRPCGSVLGVAKKKRYMSNFGALKMVDISKQDIGGKKNFWSSFD